MYKLFANCYCWHLDVERITRFCILMLKCSPLHIPKSWKDCQFSYTYKTHCNQFAILQKKLYHNCWLCRILLGCHILTFICYKVLNVYTKNPNWLLSLPPRANVCNQLRYFKQMKKKHYLAYQCKDIMLRLIR